MITSLPKKDIFTRANAQLGAANYNIVSQTETSIVYNGGKAINWVVFVLLLCLVLIGAIIYYLIAKEHQVVLNIMPVNGNIEVTGSGNTTKAQQVVNTFIASLPSKS